MEFKIGQKVNTPAVGVIKYYMGGKTVWVTFNENTAEIEFDIKHLKPYKTAHERLLDMGWKHFGEDEMGVIYENESAYLNIYKTNKYYIFETKESGKYIENKVEIDLELSRILTQYLEELNEK